MANYYGIYFTREGRVLRLPINPEELPEERDNANTEYNVLGLGPLVIPRIPKPKVVSFSGYFPGLPRASLVDLLSFQPPEVYIRFFESAMNDGAPILYTPSRFYETGIPFAISQVGFYVLVTKFITREKGGETGDFYFELELTEYRDPSPQKVQIATPTTTPSTGGAAVSSAAQALSRTTAATTATTVQTAASALMASMAPTRSIPRGQIVVGSTAILNGGYYYSPEQQLPYITAAGLSVAVDRIEAGTLPAPVHVTALDGTALGWAAKSMLSEVKNQ